MLQRPLTLLACMLTSVCALATDVVIERLDPRFDALFAADVQPERIVDGLNWLEGPAWSASDDSLLFSDIPANVIYRWNTTDGLGIFLTPSGYHGEKRFTGREPGSNGLAFDALGRLLICEHGNRRITRLDASGDRTVLVDRYRGRRLNSPNDVVVASNGDLYFTDPPFGLPRTFDDPARELDVTGVYRLSPDGELTLLIDDIGAPNGIALSGDESLLYVSDVDPQRSAWLVYHFDGDRRATGGRVLFDATALSGPGKGAPDGIEVDAAGNVLGAGPGGVFIMSPAGELLGVIRFNVPTANLAWGDDGTVLYVTASHSVWRIPTLTRGAHFKN